MYKKKRLGISLVFVFFIATFVLGPTEKCLCCYLSEAAPPSAQSKLIIVKQILTN